MTVSVLKNQIIDWLKEQDYWLQFAGNHLLESETVNAELINTIYKIFCEEYELQPAESEKPAITFVEVEDNEAVASSDLKLITIKDITNVNALAASQVIAIGPNLTIIYGANGAGKTGYIRLLNNAFNSRGDKQILKNVFESRTSGEPSCKFIFQSAEAPPYELEYPGQKESAEFSQYSVFDSYSARIHLENDNKLNFTPRGFHFFEQLVQLFDDLKEKFNAEIEKNKPLNTFINLFVNENSVKTYVTNLGAVSDEEELTGLATYTEEDKERLDELTRKKEELRGLNVPKRINELQSLLNQLSDFIAKQQAILDCLTVSDIEAYKLLINSYHEFQRLSMEQGVQSLAEYNIENLGSPEWKDFLKAAKNYATTLETIRTGNRTYPNEKDYCLLCLQPLAEKENKLINAYWGLLSSQAEIELATTIQKIKTSLQKLRGLSAVTFAEGQLIYEYVNNSDPTLAARWKILAKEIELAKQNAISNLSNCNFDKELTAYNIFTTELAPIKEAISFSIQDLIRKNPEREIQEIDRELHFLNDKELLNRLLPSVLAFIKAHKWAKKAEGCLSAFRTNSITSKQGALFTEHISDKYTRTFNEECKALNAPSIVNIVQRNAKISTLRKLQIAGEVANRILSEGEQRSISLADFLTEVQMNPYNKGVIFDDPVNSLDHQRRELIAKRLVELSEKKQVAIFTHDIAFFIRLKTIAENTPDLNLATTTIRRTSATAGIVHPDLPWIAQNIKARIGFLKNMLVRLKKAEKESLSDEYLLLAKSWYSLLREAWERTVEERLLKGVIERFSPSIQTQRLKKLVVTQELIEDIEKGMTESSNWVHDSAADLNPTPPDYSKAESDLAFLEAFAKKCEPA